MSFLVASLATRARTYQGQRVGCTDHRDRDRTDRHEGAEATRGVEDRDRAAGNGRPKPSRAWALLEALAWSGAFIDPTGVLAVERLRRAREEEDARRGRS
jgi:hypothetical protein